MSRTLDKTNLQKKPVTSKNINHRPYPYIQKATQIQLVDKVNENNQKINRRFAILQKFLTLLSSCTTGITTLARDSQPIYKSIVYYKL